MAGFLGMDVEQVRGLAQNLEQKAQTIDDIITQLTSALHNTDWKGPDAVQFKNDWDNNLVPDLRGVAQALRTASQRAKSNAQAQENTSNSF